jgi:hypothetical protein
MKNKTEIINSITAKLSFLIKELKPSIEDSECNKIVEDVIKEIIDTEVSQYYDLGFSEEDYLSIAQEYFPFFDEQLTKELMDYSFGQWNDGKTIEDIVQEAHDLMYIFPDKPQFKTYLESNCVSQLSPEQKQQVFNKLLEHIEDERVCSDNSDELYFDLDKLIEVYKTLLENY